MKAAANFFTDLKRRNIYNVAAALRSSSNRQA